MITPGGYLVPLVAAIGRNAAGLEQVSPTHSGKPTTLLFDFIENGDYLQVSAHSVVMTTVSIIGITKVHRFIAKASSVGGNELPIRLIAIDLDGTLLDDNSDIPPENIVALRQAHAAGVTVAIASGRMPPLIDPIQDRLAIDMPLIAYNGSRVVGTRAEGRPIIYDRPLAPDVAAFIVDFSKREGHLLNYFLDDRLYGEADGERSRWMAYYVARTGAEYTITDLARFDGRAPNKVILIAETPVRDRLYEYFRKELGARAEVVKTVPEFIEFMDPGVNKGVALPMLAQHCGVSTQEILAIGDQDNDIAMLEAAGIGVAVANANDNVKEAANNVTRRSNNDGGVAEAVRKVVLNE